MADIRTHKQEQCAKQGIPLRDAMDVLSGKWKIRIIGSLSMEGKMRFMDLLREIDGIAAKMLSKELVHLEANQIVSRTVLNTKPITVAYELTEHGKTLQGVINEIWQWGVLHRKKVIGEKKAA